MQFTYSWLKEFLETNATLAEISEKLTALGLEVEKIVDKSVELAPFKIAAILEAQPHPNADKLRVCKVDTGNGILQIVCGAPNARAGIKVVLAPVGSVIPTNGLKIKASSIREVESNGMLCSARELGIGEDHNGIIELAADAPLGESFVAWEGLNDPVIEIAITPNRGDCLGVYGIARDLAAAGLGTLKPLAVQAVKGSFASPVAVKIEDAKGCPLFIGRAIRGVTNPESPAWLKKRLEAIGINPISALVDITNYISFTFGRPLHVYDADKLQGSLTVRHSRAGETFTALNDKDYTLEAGLTVIADTANVLALGGIIGGKESGCAPVTKNVFLEAAFFDPVMIAEGGRKLQIDTDSRYRFERTVDRGFVRMGADIATRMILELCGGEASEYVVAGEENLAPRVINFNPEKVRTLGGVELEEKRIFAILTALGFVINGKQVTAPSWRSDVEGEADLVEEVLRVNGYDALPNTPLPVPDQFFIPALSLSQRRVAASRRLLVARGFSEAVTWSFMPQSLAVLFGGGQPELQLQNPISTELGTMRPSILPNLLDAVRRNSARGYHDLAFFEVGPVFKGVTPDKQQQVLTAVRAGKTVPRSLYGEARAVDMFDIKADVFAVLAEYGLATDKLNITRDAPDYYHPGRSCVLRLGNKPLAYIGEFHPHVLQILDVKTSAVACEVFLEAIPVPKTKHGRKPAPHWSDYQAVERDFAFIVDNATEADAVLRAVRGAEKQWITDVSLFDVYSGKGVEEGKKSLALCVTLQAQDKTLTEAEIDAVSKKIIENVVKQTNGYLRG